MDLWLGERLRSRRKELGKPLQHVANACNISVSLLSQVERGLRSISIRTLTALAAQLDVPADTLLRNAQPHPLPGDAGGVVARGGRHPLIEQIDKNIYKENLTPACVTSGLGMFRAVIQPDASTGAQLFTTYAGDQIGYIVEGQLKLFVNDQLLLLNAGDSFYYNGRMKRRWENPGTTQTIVIWAIAR